ncbi:11139_t:CDS:2 [Acaulospora morrowiae]|uniref:11139_t:CDS:1 n=1 Tax=Acaulospora morrowiae TaxID=94023 RepID=A0A9N9CPA8_9GLOM|nr:11139_t:CDS:2 [Acaulospora morrowiae]
MEVKKKLEKRYCYIPQQLVEDIVRECKVCITRRTSKRIPPMCPIVSEGFLNHVQIDTIDMTTIPDREYKYIFHIRDHFSQFSYAEQAQSKLAKEAAAIFLNFCFIYGPPAILHTDNGEEFIGNTFKQMLSFWPTIKMVYGRPRNLQCQGLVEKGNDILQVKLGSWMEETGKNDWSLGLKYIIWAMNNQYCSFHKTIPYNMIFGQFPHNETNMSNILTTEDNCKNKLESFITKENSRLNSFELEDSEMDDSKSENSNFNNSENNSEMTIISNYNNEIIESDNINIQEIEETVER